MLYDGPAIADEDVLSVYVILNGPLRMSPGKAASQTFHCGRRVISKPWEEWLGQGKRVVVRVAETEHVFERVRAECDGFSHCDEGLTEVEWGACTAFVTVPYRRADVPQILRHKRCQLYTS